MILSAHEYGMLYVSEEIGQQFMDTLSSSLNFEQIAGKTKINSLKKYVHVLIFLINLVRMYANKILLYVPEVLSNFLTTHKKILDKSWTRQRVIKINCFNKTI